VAGYCASWHNNDFSSFGRDSSQKIKAANITTAALRTRSAHSSLETSAIRALAEKPMEIMPRFEPLQ
jgi:hypothetical protein